MFGITVIVSGIGFGDRQNADGFTSSVKEQLWKIWGWEGSWVKNPRI
jgi:hypothetical protein